MHHLSTTTSQMRSTSCNSEHRVDTHSLFVDEQHPDCKRCEKASLKCEGFPDPLHIILDRSCPQTLQTSGTSVSSKNGARRPKAKRRSSNSEASEARSLLCSVTRDFYTPAISLNLSAFAENIQSTFFIAHALSKLDFGQKAVTAMWETMSAPDDPSKRALETALFGRFHHQPIICEASSKWYGKALIKLSDDLRTPQAVWSTSVLRSAIILTMYELIVATSSHGWIHHAGAISRLLEVRGPYRHQSFEERLLLEAARPLVVRPDDARNWSRVLT